MLPVDFDGVLAELFTVFDDEQDTPAIFVPQAKAGPDIIADSIKQHRQIAALMECQTDLLTRSEFTRKNSVMSLCSPTQYIQPPHSYNETVIWVFLSNIQSALFT